MIEKGILCGKSSGPSCRLIRDYIKEQTGEEFPIAKDKTKIRNVVIRYGHAGRVIGEDTDFNNRSGILLLGNKKKFSELMKLRGVKSPEFFQTIDPPTTYPVLIRKTLISFGGKGIIYCENENDFMRNYRVGDYWTPVIPFEREFRFHCVGGRVGKIFLKEPNEGHENDRIRNNSNCHFSRRNERYFESAVHYVEENILPFIQVKFCGLDVALDHNNNFVCVFEGNSAPGISIHTAKFYGDYLIDNIFNSYTEL